MRKTLSLLALACMIIGCRQKEEPMLQATIEAPPEEAFERSSEGLLDPSALTATAPATFRVKFETTQGDFVVQAHRDWAPLGVDRFYNLVGAGFFDDTAFFRAIDGFMAQFGIHGDAQVNAAWQSARIEDDPDQQPNSRGRLSFAMGGPDTRTTQMFINFVDNSKILPTGFPPIGEVTSGMDVVDSLHTGYGEGAPRGRGPMQQLIQSRGNAYLRENFPELDYIERATVIE